MLKSGITNVIGQVLRVIASLLTIPLLTRLLGLEEYGLWVLVTAVVGFVMLAEAGLTTSTVVFVSQDLAKEDTRELVSSITILMLAMFALATVAALGLWLLAPSLVLFFPNLNAVQQQTLHNALQIGAVFIWVQLLQQLTAGIEQAYQRYDIMNLLRVIQAVGTSVGLLIVAWHGGKVVELMVAQTLISVIILVLHFGTIRWLMRDIKLTPVWNSSKGINILKYSLVTWIGTIGGTFFLQGDRLIVGRLLGAEVLGIYAAITSLAIQINSISGLLVQPILPQISTLFAQGSEKSLVLIRTYFQRAVVLNVLAAVGLGMLLIVWAPLALRFMLPRPPVAIEIYSLRICALIYTLYSLNAVGYYVLFATKGVQANTIIVIFSGCLALLLIWFFANRIGLVGAISGNIGFVITITLLWISANRIALPIYHLAQAYYIPCIWLFAELGISSFLSDTWAIHLVLTFIGCIVLLVWFARYNAKLEVIKIPIFLSKSA